MAEPRALPPGTRLPTLTEVVVEGLRAPVAPAPAWGPEDEARIVDAVMASLKQRMDLMFEYRLREALAPVLARVAETLVDEMREELARTLRDVVARAVSQELSHRRTR
ncbi:MAG: hypothetical protein U1F56_24595 [Rubrivivax sp.]